MAKEFRKSFMHKTRRKLVDMVQTGVYERDTKIGWNKKDIHREVGDIWEDKHSKYEQKDGYVVKTSKNSEVLQQLRTYLEIQNTCKNKECKRVKKSKTDKKLIKKTGYCIDCLAVIETEIKANGFWEEYQNYKVWTRMIVHGKLRLEQVQQAHDEAKQVYEYINEDGSLESWTMPQSVEDVKKEMKELIKNGNVEILELEQKRNKAFKILKENGYEHNL